MRKITILEPVFSYFYGEIRDFFADRILIFYFWGRHEAYPYPILDKLFLKEFVVNGTYCQICFVAIN